MHTSLPSLAMIAFAAINAFIALDMSGEAGHGLEDELGKYAVHLYHTSAKYHMWHVLGLMGLAVLYDLWTDRWSRLCIGLPVSLLPSAFSCSASACIIPSPSAARSCLPLSALFCSWPDGWLWACPP